MFSFMPGILADGRVRPARTVRNGRQRSPRGRQDGRMTDPWTAPGVTRPIAPYASDEREMLDGYLDFQRATLLWKCTGLNGEQLVRRAAEPAVMSLLGLVRHMAWVERWWFQVHAAGRDLPLPYQSAEDPDLDFNGADPARAAEDFAAYLAECDAARHAVADLPLEHTVHNERRRADVSLRWIYLHMIEEYARHNGHADLLRERVDGTTGA
jgi:hypothetical protein